LGRLLHPLGLFSLQNIDQVCQYARSDFAVGRDSDEDEQMKICACIIRSTTAPKLPLNSHLPKAAVAKVVAHGVTENAK